MSKTQAECDAFFKDVGAAFSMVKRLREAKDLLSTPKFFAFVKADVYGNFPNPETQLDEVKGLKRGKNFSQTDDILRIQVDDSNPGVTYDLRIVDSFGGTTLSTITAGAYGSKVTLVASTPDGPTGKIQVEAPSPAPGAGYKNIQIRLVPSAVKLPEDVYGETAAELETRGALQEAMRVVGANLTGALFEDLEEETGFKITAIEAKLLKKLLATFLGSSSETIIVGEPQQNSNGAVFFVASGLLKELDTFMLTNSPAQTVQQNTVSAGATTITGVGNGTLTKTPRQNALPGTYQLICSRGFSDSAVDDPEEFSVSAVSFDLGISEKSTFPLRIFQDWEEMKLGTKLNLKRQTSDNDAHTRMTNEDLRKCTTTRIPLNKLQVKTVHDTVTPGNSYFRIYEPKFGTLLYEDLSGQVSTGLPTPNGTYTLNLSNGLSFAFTWTNNVAANGAGEVVFDVTITPFEAGDMLTFEMSNSLAGRFLKELTLMYRFPLRASGAPTVADAFVTPDLPYVKPKLGV